MRQDKGELSTAEQRRSSIAQAARELALSDGLSAITLRTVAARAGMTPPLVAHYITSMEDLSNETFLSIVRAQLEALHVEMEERSPVDQLSSTLERLFDEKYQEIDVVWAEAWSLGRRRESLAAILRDESDHWLDAFERIVQAGQDQGVFHVGDVRGAAFALLCIIDGSNAHALVRWGDPAERLALLESTIENLLGARPGTLRSARSATARLRHETAPSGA